MNPRLATVKINAFGDVKRQIVEAVRTLIQAGHLPTGEKLPSTAELAAQWDVRLPTVQAALAALTKSGLLDRKPKSGTFVRAQGERLQRVGIFFGDRSYLCIGYHPLPQAIFGELCQLLETQEIEYSLWMDPRPAGEAREKPWTKLVQAAENREFQALIVLCAEGEQAQWLPNLTVPLVSFCNSPAFPHIVAQDPLELAMTGVEALAQQGCRRVGFIHPLVDSSANHPTPDPRNVSNEFTEKFRTTARAMDMECRPEWILRPTPPHPDTPFLAQNFEPFGYQAMLDLWAQPQRPDGLFVCFDFTARGALQAVNQLGINIPGELKLALYRNGVDQVYFNRFPAAYVDSDPTGLAERLFQQTLALFSGHATAVELVHWRLISAPASSAFNQLPSTTSR